MLAVTSYLRVLYHIKILVLRFSHKIFEIDDHEESILSFSGCRKWRRKNTLNAVCYIFTEPVWKKSEIGHADSVQIDASNTSYTLRPSGALSFEFAQIIFKMQFTALQLQWQISPFWMFPSVRKACQTWLLFRCKIPASVDCRLLRNYKRNLQVYMLTLLNVCR
jgi:hypothetical protein